MKNQISFQDRTNERFWDPTNFVSFEWQRNGKQKRKKRKEKEEKIFVNFDASEGDAVYRIQSVKSFKHIRVLWKAFRWFIFKQFFTQ